jgi:hypothetical protein
MSSNLGYILVMILVSGFFVSIAVACYLIDSGRQKKNKANYPTNHDQRLGSSIFIRGGNGAFIPMNKRYRPKSDKYRRYRRG